MADGVTVAVSGQQPPRAGTLRRSAAALASAFALAVAVSCQAPAAGEADDAASRAAAPTDPADFDASRAWGHLEQLVSFAPRTSGSDGARRARAYIEEQLVAAGFEVERDEASVELPDGGGALELQPLRATRAGDSADVILLVAPYTAPRLEADDAVDPGANEGASGAAVLLELARIRSRAVHPYSLVLAFVDGDAHLSAAPFIGSEALVGLLEKEGILDRTRAVVFVDRVGDVDLQVVRDLRSNRSFRDFFWRSARDLGLQAYFQQEGFETPAAGHLAFLAHGHRRSVALVDTRHGGGQEPGAWARSPQDTLEHCTPTSLGVVGRVIADGISRFEARLARIDRFARAPAAVTVADERERHAAAAVPLTAPASSSAGEQGAVQPAASDPALPAHATVAATEPEVDGEPGADEGVPSDAVPGDDAQDDGAASSGERDGDARN